MHVAHLLPLAMDLELVLCPIVTMESAMPTRRESADCCRARLTVLTTLLFLWFPTPILALNAHDLAQIGLCLCCQSCDA